MARTQTIALGPFLLEGVAGRGGMGTIWRGTVSGRDVPVAVKVLHPDRAKGATYREAFRREVRAMARLSHPSIVDVYDDGEISAEESAQHPAELTEASPYFAMAWADAGTLGSTSGETPTRDFVRIRSALLQILGALAHAHARGVVHRDLKPDNVLAFAGPDGLRYKLADFGVAHALGTEAGEARAAGTPHYMAPEQFRGAWRDFGPWTDLYALGAVAFELLTGKRPFAATGLFGLMKAHTEQPPPNLPPEVDAPLGMSAWLQWLMAKDPAARPACAAEATAALVALGPALGPVGAPWATLATASERSAVATEAPTTQGATSVSLDELLEDAPKPASPTRPHTLPVPRDWRGAGGGTMRPGPLRGMGMSLVELRDPELVGREQERDRLWSQLRGVIRARRAAAVIVRGPAGMGKSRLARWLTERAHELGAARGLRLRPQPHDPSGGLGLIVSHLRADGLSGAALQKRLRGLPALSAFDASSMARTLSPATEGMNEPMSAHDIRAVTHRALHHVAGQWPLVVWVDDAHMHEESLLLTRHLLRMQAAQPHPTLVVCTVQDESVAELPSAASLLAELGAREDVCEVSLGPLNAREQRSLLMGRLGLATDVIDSLAERTGGNPLFAAQLVEDWVRRDVLEPRTTGYGLRADASVLLPDDLFELWRARVERWLSSRDAGDRMALELLAIGGSDVAEASWRAVCDAAGVGPERRFVEELMAQRLADAGPDGVQLVHGMLRESLVREAQSAGRATRHHRAWAHWLATRIDEDPHHVPELGRHLLAAGEQAAAVEHLLAGARLLGDRGAFAAADQVMVAWRRALRQLGASEDDPRWAPGLVIEARYASLRGQDERAERAVRRALDHAFDEVSLADALLAAAQVAERQGRRRDAQSRYRSAYERFETLDDDLGRGRAAIGLGTLAVYFGELEEAHTHHREAMLRLGTAGAELELARAERQLANAFLTESPPRARELYRRALARFEMASAEVDQHKTLNGIAESYRLEGNLEQALAQFEALLERQEQGAATHDQDLTRFNMALTLIGAGRYRQAEATLAQVAAALEARPHEVLEVGLVFCAIPCAAARGAWPRFDAGLRRARAEMQREGLVEHDDAVNLRLAGELAAEAGQPDRARAAYGLAARIWRDIDKDASAAMRARVEALTPPEPT